MSVGTGRRSDWKARLTALLVIRSSVLSGEHILNYLLRKTDRSINADTKKATPTNPVKAPSKKRPTVRPNSGSHSIRTQPSNHKAAVVPRN